jgi:hypothetical protein
LQNIEYFKELDMFLKKLNTGFAAAFLLMVVFGPNVTNADEEGAQGRVWYESTEDSEWAMDMTIVDGIAIPKDTPYGKQATVLLLGEPLDHGKFLAVLAETGHPLLTMSKLSIEDSVSFNICSDDDGSNAEVCHIAIHGPGLSFSESGFDAYNHFTESLSFENNRVAAKLKTEKPEEKPGVIFGLDLSFDLPISTYVGQ